VENIILSHHHHQHLSLLSTFTIVIYLCHRLLCTQFYSFPLVLSCSPQLNCGEHHTLSPSSFTFVIIIYIHHCRLHLPSPLVYSVSFPSSGLVPFFTVELWRTSYSLAVIINVCHHHLRSLLLSTFAITSCVLSVLV
jgi:hypothetical protein